MQAIRASDTNNEFNTHPASRVSAHDSSVGIDHSVISDNMNSNISKEEVTTFHDVSAIEKTTHIDSDSSMFDRASVYDEITLKGFLGIPQIVEAINWSATDDNLVITFDALNRLCDNPVFWSKLSYWKYLRADIELEIRTNGTPMHYGALLVSSLPLPYGIDQESETLTSDIKSHSNPYSLITKHHVIVQPTKAATYKLVLPFVSSKMFLDIDAYQDGTSAAGKMERTLCGFDRF